MLPCSICGRDLVLLGKPVPIACDLLEPAFGKALGVGGETLSVQVEAPMRAGADAGIGAVTPVEKIVPRLRTGVRVVEIS